MGLFGFGKKKKEAAAGKAQALYERGMDWYTRFEKPQYSDYCHAGECFKEAAEMGHARARYMMGLFRYNGWGMEEVDAEAFRWFRLSAEQGVTEAEYWLGFLYETGTGVKKDYDEAMRWMSRAAAKGHTEALQRVGDLYGDGKGCTRDTDKALSYWTKAAEQGDVYSMTCIGDEYLKRNDREQAEAWFRKAEDAGSTYARDQLDDMGVLSNATRAGMEKSAALKAEIALAAETARADAAAACERGTELFREGSITYAREWLAAAVENGSAEAAYQLSELSRKDWDYFARERDERTLYWLRRAAEMGHREGMGRLGWTLAIGALGADVNLEEALRLVKQAAELGDTTSAAILKNWYTPVEEGDRHYELGNKEAARCWYRLGAEQGRFRAAFKLAELYHKGDGVKYDPEKARLWYRQSADLGNRYALAVLGQLEFEEENYNETIKCILPFAEEGDMFAMWNIGLCYFRLDEHIESANWYERSAEAGYPRARYNLAIAYANGRGRPEDRRKAAELAKEAYLAGIAEAGSLLDFLGEKRP